MFTLLSWLFRLISRYLLACLVGGLVVMAIGLTGRLFLADESGSLLSGLPTLLFVTLANTVLMALVSAPPSFVFITFARWMRLRSALLYCAAGLVIAVGVFVAMSMGMDGSSGFFRLRKLMAIAFGGAVAGYVYWLRGPRILGRKRAGVPLVQSFASNSRKAKAPKIPANR